MTGSRRTLWTGAALLALGLAVAAPEAGAQTILGVVVDDETEAPIEAARVALVALDGSEVAEAITDRFGVFQLGRTSAGSYLLQVSRLGYAALETPVEVARASLQLRLRMGVEAIPLEPVEVLLRAPLALGPMAEFDERRDDPTLNGYFLDRTDIQRRPVATPSQLLVTVPNVNIRPLNPGGLERSLIFLPGPVGPCLAETFINGARVPQSLAHSVDDILASNQLGGVEVYPRPGLAPVQYRGEGRCGVVLFWLDPQTEEHGEGWSIGRIAVGGVLILGIISVVLTSN